MKITHATACAIIKEFTYPLTAERELSDFRALSRSLSDL